MCEEQRFIQLKGLEVDSLGLGSPTVEASAASQHGRWHPDRSKGASESNYLARQEAEGPSPFYNQPPHRHSPGSRIRTVILTKGSASVT
jgi:hypothetical protein